VIVGVNVLVINIDFVDATVRKGISEKCGGYEVIGKARKIHIN